MGQFDLLEIEDEKLELIQYGLEAIAIRNSISVQEAFDVWTRIVSDDDYFK